MNKIFLSLLLPFLLWLAVHHDFFTGRLFIGADNRQYFHWVSYHIENMMRGVYPLWNPFHAWGAVDNFDILFIGGFNPIYFAIGLLTLLGVNPYWAFVIIILLYFWLGCFGFYVLSRRIMGGHWGPWLAYVFLIFSSFGNAVFWQLCILVISVPAVWFLVFLIGFIRSQTFLQRKHQALGLTFAVMMILTSYMPFYFIVLFLCFILACLICAPHWFGEGIKAFGKFVHKTPWIAGACCAAMLTACIPSALWYWESNGGEYVLLADRAANGSKDAASVPLENINSGGLLTETSWEEMFSDFDIALNHLSYVPVLVFILFMMSFLNRARRAGLVVFLTGFFLFIVGLTNVTFVHAFLYKHIFIFHLFRNYFFFWPWLIALGILFVIGELIEFLSQKTVFRPKKVMRVLYGALIHGIFLIFLLRLNYVPVSSLGTVILSALWFLSREFGFLQKRQYIFMIGLGVIAVIQPMQVLPYFDNRLCAKAAIAHPFTRPEFVYTRPSEGQGFNEEHGFHWREKLLKDESGFVKAGYFGTKWSYDMHTLIPHEVLQEYVRNKFVIYDRSIYWNPNDPHWDQVGERLKNLTNEALVHDQRAVSFLAIERNISNQAQVLDGPMEALKVTAFDLNRIDFQTNFPTRKFIVYNDSYHTGWQAFVDGKRVELYRANMSFKGLWVEAGMHRVHLQFRSFWYHAFFFGLSLFFLLWFIAVLVYAREDIS